MSDVNPDVQEVFCQALEIADPSEQAAYVVQACGGDPAKQQRVEALLKAHCEAGKFLGGQPREGESTTDKPLLERPGTQIGPYKLRERIGEGGFGVVYVAEQERPVRRKVALKVIKPGMDTKDVIARFEAERQALALMEHPNVARVFDAGATASGRPYFVMELVHGIPITEFCDKNKLPMCDRLRLFIDVCRAVQHAHQKGIIHRDLKPSNIMVTLHDGEPVAKVIDFGVSKALSQQLTEKSIYTAYGQMIGTPTYMSPEQAEMSGLGIDTRSDIYSLGVLLYELLTGKTPLDAQRLRSSGYAEILRIIREEEPPRPSLKISTLGEEATAIAQHRHTDVNQLRRALRGELDWIVMKCLEKDRSRRYETATGLARDVERFLADEPVEARPPSAAYRLKKVIQKYRAALATVMTIAVVLVTSTIVSVWLAVRAGIAERRAEAALIQRNAEKTVADEARQTAVAERDRADQLADQRRHQLYVSDMWVVQQSLAAANIQRAVSTLTRHIPGAGETDLRGFEWYYLWNHCRRSLTTPTITHGGARITDAKFSPDGRLLATCGSDQRVRLWNVIDGSLQSELAGHTSWVRSCALSPDGKRIATGSSDTTVRLWQVQTGELLHVFAWPTVPNSGVNSHKVRPVAFSPDGTLIAAGYSDPGSVRLWNAETFAEIATLDGHESRTIWELEFASDGKRILTCNAYNTATVWDVETRKICFASAKQENARRRELSDTRYTSVTGTYDRPQYHRAVLSPDGQSVLLWTVGRADAPRIVDVNTGTDLVLLESGTPINQATFSPDGTSVATSHPDGSLRIWERTTGRTQRALAPHSLASWAVAFSPDSRTLASGGVDNTVKLWDANTGELLDSFTGHSHAVAGLAFSPSGDHLLSKGEDQVIKLWAVDKRQRPVSFRQGASAIRAIDISSSGWLVSGGDDGILRLWNMTTRRESRDLLKSQGAIVAAQFSFDGTRLLWASAAGECGVLDAVDWKSLDRQKMPSREFTAGAFSRSGQLVALVDRRKSLLMLLECASGRLTPLNAVHSDQLSDTTSFGVEVGLGKECVSFSPDEQEVAIGVNTGHVRRWNPRTGVELSLLGRREAWERLDAEVAYRGAGRTLLSGGADGEVTVWDLGTNEVATVLRGHGSTITAIASSIDGKTVVSAGADLTIRIWDLQLGRERCILSGHAASITSMAFSHDGTLLVSADEAGEIRLWEAATAERVTADLRRSPVQLP